MKNLLAAATLCLSLATPAFASVELLPEQLDSVTAGVQLILTFTDATAIPGFTATLESQGWQKVSQVGNTLTMQIGLDTPKITVNPFTVNP